MTALSMIQETAAWIALDQRTAAFSEVDLQTVQLRSLLNEELLELRMWPDTWWRKLIRQHTFTSTATDVQPADAVPDDFDYIIPATMWDRTQTRPCVGPIDPQAWQAWVARPILTSVIWGWRLRGNDFLTAPNPPSGDTVAYEYISNYAVYSEGEDVPDKETFTADTDTSIFNETLMSRGLRWRFLRAKGLDYSQEYQVWISLLQRLAARDKGMPILNAAGSSWPAMGGPYVPSFDWPGA